MFVWEQTFGKTLGTGSELGRDSGRYGAVPVRQAGIAERRASKLEFRRARHCVSMGQISLPELIRRRLEGKVRVPALGRTVRSADARCQKNGFQALLKERRGSAAPLVVANNGDRERVSVLICRSQGARGRSALS